MESEESHDLPPGGPGKLMVLFQFKPEDLRTRTDKGGKNSVVPSFSAYSTPMCTGCAWLKEDTQLRWVVSPSMHDHTH